MNNPFFLIIRLFFMMFLKFIKNIYFFINNFVIKVMDNYELISNYVLNRILKNNRTNKELFIFLKVFLYLSGTLFFIYLYTFFSQVIKEIINYFNKFFYFKKCSLFKTYQNKSFENFSYFTSILLSLVKSKKYNLFNL